MFLTRAWATIYFLATYHESPKPLTQMGGGGNYDKVYIQPFFNFRSDDYKRLIWEANPYVDGVLENYHTFSKFSWQNLKKPNIKPPYINPESPPFFAQNNKNLPFTRGENLLDKIMLFFGLDDGKRMHEPEIYYKPKFRPEFHKVIFDPNWISNIGSIDFADILHFFKEMNVKIDAVMAQKPSGKNSQKQQNACFDYDIDTEFIETPTLEDFCDLIYSAKAIYCFVTGTATLCAALGKSANVLVGTSEPYICPRYLHSQLHKYYNIFPALSKIAPKRVWRFKNFGIKWQIKFKQKNFARILKMIKAILPKDFGVRIAERLDMAFGANPDGTITPRESKTRYDKLCKEVFVMKK